MKVKDLIEKLQSCNPESEVCIADNWDLEHVDDEQVFVNLWSSDLRDMLDRVE